MRANIVLDDHLLERVQKLTGIKTLREGGPSNTLMAEQL
jgi:Arc/MetJ family transcription regulator